MIKRSKPINKETKVAGDARTGYGVSNNDLSYLINSPALENSQAEKKIELLQLHIPEKC
jgi:hypothetical protein